MDEVERRGACGTGAGVVRKDPFIFSSGRGQALEEEVEERPLDALLKIVARIAVAPSRSVARIAIAPPRWHTLSILALCKVAK